MTYRFEIVNYFNAILYCLIFLCGFLMICYDCVNNPDYHGLGDEEKVSCPIGAVSNKVLLALVDKPAQHRTYEGGSHFFELVGTVLASVVGIKIFMDCFCCTK